MLPKSKMSNSVEELPLPRDPPDIICRGCLKEWGEMKNMYQTGLDVDFFKYTNIPRKLSDGFPEMLCTNCEEELKSARRFKDKCQESDAILRLNMKKKSGGRYPRSKGNKTQVTPVYCDNELILMITAPNPDDKIILKCTYENCTAEFHNSLYLRGHLNKIHGHPEDLQIVQQFYCTEENCVYNRNSKPNKFFTGRKFLNQHMNKSHKDKVYICKVCHAKFPTATDYNRHLRTCNMVYLCAICDTTYSTNEAYLVHLSRRHPSLHAKYKQAKKAHKRSILNNNNTEVVPPKKIKQDSNNSRATVTTPPGAVENTPSVLERESENTFVPNDPQPLKITEIPPWRLNIDIINNSVAITQLNLETEPINNAGGESAVGETITAEAVTLIDAVTEVCFDEVIADDEHIIEEEVIDEDATAIADTVAITEHIEEAKDMLGSDYGGDYSYGEKKSSATQVPEHITNDVSLNSWDNKTDFEIQTDEMSTQTVFEDLLRSQQDDIFFSESVSLSDIQTQTVPLEFGLTQNNKGTQSQAPGLSFKETQTNFDQYDNDGLKRNFKMFDSRSPSPAAGSFISNAQTQTTDFRSPIRADVLLSFSSTETQTYYDDFRYASM